jgi:hypoxanthine phosphoribosyltransferase
MDTQSKDHKIQSSYLNEIFNKDFINIINSLVKTIKQSKIEFDAIAFTGQSGAMVATVLCYKLKKLPLLIRKTTDNAHSDYKLEGPLDSFKYIIVDDMISSGRTIADIISEIVKSTQNSNLTGIFFYSHSSWDDFDQKLCLLPVVPVRWRLRNQTSWFSNIGQHKHYFENIVEKIKNK